MSKIYAKLKKVTNIHSLVLIRVNVLAFIAFLRVLRGNLVLKVKGFVDFCQLKGKNL